jgi:hypothetical protein
VHSATSSRARALSGQWQNNIVGAVRKREHDLHISQVCRGNKVNGVARVLKRASRPNVFRPFSTFAKEQVGFAVLQDDLHINYSIRFV